MWHSLKQTLIKQNWLDDIITGDFVMLFLFLFIYLSIYSTVWSVRKICFVFRLAISSLRKARYPDFGFSCIFQSEIQIFSPISRLSCRIILLFNVLYRCYINCAALEYMYVVGLSLQHCMARNIKFGYESKVPWRQQMITNQPTVFFSVSGSWGGQDLKFLRVGKTGRVFIYKVCFSVTMLRPWNIHLLF